MKAIGWMTAIAGAAVVIAVAAARRNGPAPEHPPKTAWRTIEDPAPDAGEERIELPRRSPPLAAAVDRSAGPDETEFWSEVKILLETKTGPGGVQFRRFLIERTLRHLAWEGSRGLAFASAAEVAVQETEAAWSLREARIATDDDESVHSRYEECKRTALARIEGMLDPSREPERRFHERLEEWFDAIR